MLWYVNYPESETLFVPMHNLDFSYPAHLHGCMEISFCVGGQAEVTLGEKTESLTPGYGILIPPNTLHSYHTAERSEYYTILFSRNLLPDLSAMLSRKQPRTCIFQIDPPLHRQLLEFYRSEQTLFGGKSLLYRVAEAFLKGNTFENAYSEGDDLTRKILSYIQDNLQNAFTLRDLADHLGYSYFYISKRIRQVVTAASDGAIAAMAACSYMER